MQREHSNSDSSVTRRDFLKTTAAVSAVALATGCGVGQMAHAQGADTIRIGLVGCGGRGRGAVQNAVAAAKGVKVVAIGDLFADAVEDTRKAYAERPREQYDIGNRCFVGWDAYLKVINSDIDYIILASPPGFRPMMIDAAVKAGKHVFAEKPVAVCPTGVRQVIAACDEAQKKNVGIVCGTQRRHQPSYIETIKRIKAGAIGNVVSGQCYWTQGPSWDPKPRRENWSDTEYQIRNWMYYLWLSGDFIVEQHMHQVDVMNWVIGSTPRFALGTGGRQVRTEPQFGHIWDHFAIEYVYPNDVHVLSFCWQQQRTYSRPGAEAVQGSKGSAIPASKITGGNAWQFEADDPGNPYEIEHKDFIASIRAGQPLNEGKTCAESTLTAIMGRTAAYTGKLITWPMMMNSKLDLTCKSLEFGPRPVPPVPMPGKEPFLM